MRKIVTVLFLSFMCGNVYAIDVSISNAKITKVEFYGNQFTVYFDKTHSATGCGHSASVAMDSSGNPGKAYMSVMLAAWTTGKLINARITDSVCNGDRPTIKNFNAR